MTDSTDPRLEAVAEAVLQQFGSKSNSPVALAGHRLIARRMLAAADAADEAAGVRRVNRDYLRCPGCERYYDANGVACYRDGIGTDEWHCEDAAADSPVGGVS